MSDYKTISTINIDIGDKLKEKESDCSESILHFILSSHNKYKLLEKMVFSSSIALVEEIP